jgi:hypothetical protein
MAIYAVSQTEANQSFLQRRFILVTAGVVAALCATFHPIVMVFLTTAI